MVDATELLGALLKRGMTESSQGRVENSLNDDALAGILEQEFGASRPSANPLRPTAAQTRAPSRTPVAVPAEPEYAPRRAPEAPRGRGPEAGATGRSSGGGLGGLLEGMFGKSFKQAAGAGALALLASIALKALKSSGSKGASRLAGASGLLSGDMSAAENQAPVQMTDQAQSMAQLAIKAMINAAKVDGRIDEDEFQKIAGELQGEVASPEAREFLMAEVRKPLCTEEIVRAVQDPAVGAQVYAASLLAIEVDSPAEKAYLQKLAGDLGLNSQVVQEIHSVMGMQ